jgi:hypothetical protein
MYAVFSNLTLAYTAKLIKRNKYPQLWKQGIEGIYKAYIKISFRQFIVKLSCFFVIIEMEIYQFVVECTLGLPILI